MSDEISIVEAAYRMEASHQVWLGRVLEACAPRLFDGLGGFASWYQRDAPTPTQMVSPYTTLGADPRLTTALRAQFEQTDDATRRLAFTIGKPVATLTDLFDIPPRDHPAFAELARRVGFGDVITVNAHNPDGTGCFLSAPLRRSVRRPSAARWEKVAAHVAAGLRLQLRFASAALTPASEAVMSSDGRVLHASRRAARWRDVLRAATQAVDSVRSRRGRRDVDGALDAWTALVEGRWSLVDTFESDGRRLVLAVPNRPSALDPRALSPDERVVASYVARGDSNKLIAYTLGVPLGTVATRVRATLRKLGVPSRAALAERYVTLCAMPFGPASLDGVAIMIGAARPDVEFGAGLTEAERAVAVLAALGRSNAEIAAERGVASGTVANLLGRVYRRLGISSRAELAMRARRS